jgi:hypothetical protein
VSVEARGGSSLRRCIGGDCAAEWKEECVDVDSIEGDLRLDTRGGARCDVSSPSSSSVMTASCLDELGTERPLLVSFSDATGLGE